MTPRPMQWTAHSISFRSTRINLIRRRVPAFLTFTIYLLSAFRSTVRMQDCVWGNVRGGTMIKPALQVESATTSWRAGPVQLIDRLVDKFLDHIEQMSHLVVRVPADRPCYVRIQSRVDQYPP